MVIFKETLALILFSFLKLKIFYKFPIFPYFSFSQILTYPLLILQSSFSNGAKLDWIAQTQLRKCCLTKYFSMISQ